MELGLELYTLLTRPLADRLSWGEDHPVPLVRRTGEVPASGGPREQ